MEGELSKLKRMYADLALENRALKNLIEKSTNAGRETGGRACHADDPRGFHHAWVCRGQVRLVGVLSESTPLAGS